MKIRLLFTLAGLAIGFAAPVLAQEQTQSIKRCVNKSKR
jgi:hypothetical protein